jgi:hypothetical protein
MKAMGDSYPKRGGLRIHQEKPKMFFYDPKATPELIDEVYASVNDQN